PEVSIRGKGQTIRSAESGTPGLGWSEVGAGEGVGSYDRSLLGGFGVLRRIDDGDGVRAGFACHGIARGRFAVQSEAQDFAEWLVRILGRGHALAVAGGEVEQLAVGREGDGGAELSTFAAFGILPDDLEVFEAGCTITELQFGSGKREAGTVDARLGVGEIDVVVLRVMRRDIDAEHSALSVIADGGHI